MNIEDIVDTIKSFRSEGKILTNLYYGSLDNIGLLYKAKKNESSIVIEVDELHRKKAYFAGVDEDSIVEQLLLVPQGTILECMTVSKTNDEYRCLLENSSFKQYDIYVRKTYVFKYNPYKLLNSGVFDMLQRLYDPGFGEYASERDAFELLELHRRYFNILTDDLFRLEDWMDVINDKRCVIYKNREKIITYYVYRVEGKKLYSNASLNLGPANYLYNLERSVFEKFWSEGIRTRYAWYSVNNEKALKRRIPEDSDAVKSVGEIYNHIYIKN